MRSAPLRRVVSGQDPDFTCVYADYFPPGDDTMFYHFLKQILDEGRYFVGVPIIITNGANVTTKQANAMAVAEFGTSVVLGTWQSEYDRGG